MFIVDPDTPRLDDTAALNAFEPKFIKDVQRVIGAKVKGNIGTMYMIHL
jgi:hypothetical protein